MIAEEDSKMFETERMTPELATKLHRAADTSLELAVTLSLVFSNPAFQADLHDVILDRNVRGAEKLQPESFGDLESEYYEKQYGFKKWSAGKAVSIERFRANMRWRRAVSSFDRDWIETASRKDLGAQLLFVATTSCSDVKHQVKIALRARHDIELFGVGLTMKTSVFLRAAARELLSRVEHPLAARPGFQMWVPWVVSYVLTSPQPSEHFTKIVESFARLDLETIARIVTVYASREFKEQMISVFWNKKMSGPEIESLRESLV